MPDVVEVRSTGDAAPLFLVHDMDGEGRYFSALADHIDADVPVYGLLAVPLDEPQLHTVEAMASRLVRLVRSVSPGGPYRIAGWSFGGILAYELAVQLLGLDEEVQFLGLLDSRAPSSRNTSQLRRRTPEDALVAILRLEHAAESAHSVVVDRLEEQAAELGIDGMVDACRQPEILPAHLCGSSVPFVRQYCARYAAHLDAFENFAAQPISVPVHLFVAAGHHGAGDAPQKLFLGWEAVVPESRLIVHRVPGSHTSMLGRHVAQLGHALSASLETAAAAQRGGDTRVYEALVPIQDGDARSGTIFCVPGAGANVSSFIPFSIALGSSWAVRGLMPRGLDAPLEPHTTVEAAASAYLRAIAARPRGAIHLLGHSFGGWVVFEMARRMLERGHGAASVTLVDTEPPGAAADEYTALDVLNRWVEVVELGAAQPLGIAPSALAPLDRSATFKLLHERLVKHGVMPRRSDPEALHGSVRAFATAVRTGYVPQSRYPGPVHLVCVTDHRVDERTNRQRLEAAVSSWKRWAPEIRPWTGPGNHVTVLKDSHAAVLADWWKSVASR